MSSHVCIEHSNHSLFMETDDTKVHNIESNMIEDMIQGAHKLGHFISILLDMK